MKITVIGSGYVGLVSGICFATIGHEVVCIDKDEAKIAKLKSGIIPIFEPGLSDLLLEAKQAQKISFTTDLKAALKARSTESIPQSKLVTPSHDGVHSLEIDPVIRRGDNDVCEAVFIAVGTPQDEDGSADLSYVLSAAKEIAEFSDSYKLIITKSTVPAGTGEKIKKLVLQTNPQLEFSIASNPEFLREGAAIDDFMNPDRIVIGVEDEKSKKIMSEIYQKFPSEKIIFTDVITSELIKYAANSFLATKISFINEMADLCEIIGGDVKQLAKAMGADSRIGEKFLNPGPGFGGSCFPKDIMAILNVAKEKNVDLSLISSVVTSNKNRQEKMVEKVLTIFDGKISGKKIALLGLAFKANTDDIRYSPAISIAKKLLEKGAKISAHDPEAITNSKYELKEFSQINFFEDVYEAIVAVDLIIIATEWKSYSELDFEKIKQLTKSRKIFDLRNLFDARKVKNFGFEYFYIGGKSS